MKCRYLTISELIEKQSSSTKGEVPSIRLLIAITAAWFLGQMCYYAQGQMLGPLMVRFDLDEVEVGVMFSQEVMVLALMTLLIAGPLSQFSRVRVAMTGGLLLIIANLVSATTESFELLRMMRLLSGASAAVIGAAGTASAASSLNPQRVFAIITVTWGLMAALQPVLVPYLTVPFGAAGGYYGMAVVAALFLPFCGWLIPPRRAERDVAANYAANAVRGLSPVQRMAEFLGVRDAPNTRYALIVMFALFVYEIGQSAVQLFQEQIGLRSGLEEFAIGQLIGIAGLGGLIGAVFAAWLGDRFGNFRPLIIALCLNIVLAAALSLADSPTVFAVSDFLWTTSYYFLLPYVMGLLAELDDKGRWAVAVDGMWWFGSAPSAAVGTMAVATGGYLALSTVPLTGGVVCLVLLVVSLKKFYAKQQQDKPLDQQSS